MLWLCLRFPQLAHEAGAASQGRTAASASVTMQTQALERLAAWAYQWSSQISYQAQGEALLWLELQASQSLFGGPQALLARLQDELQQLGYSYHWALAPSPSAAALLTRLALESGAPLLQQRCVFTRAELRARLHSLPLSLLCWPEGILDALRSAGLERIGQLQSLPAAALARRFGPEISGYLRRLYGLAPDPRASWQPPSHYRARFEFDAEVHDTTAMLFPLQRLLLEFQGYLRGRDCAVLRFTLQLEHHRAPADALTIGLSAPAREAAQFLLLVRERLQSVVLHSPLSGIALEASEFTAPAVVQADFFGSDAQQLQQLQLLLDRLRARLGASQIQGLQSFPDHRPEHAWRLAEPLSSAVHAGETPTLSRPCALLPKAQPMRAPTQLVSGPERIESGWWDGQDVRRDYYVARAEDGVLQWVFRDRRRGDWYLQGWWV